ncbi:MAG: protein kinase [Gammaproteobacteria bacterium]|nr:protein kinase [Gammaproteobacteria bacterium]
MPHLHLTLFGQPQLSQNDQPIDLKSRKGLALLAYLAVEGSGQSRDGLAALLWPEYDQSRARANQRRTLFTLNKTPVRDWLAADPETIALRLDDADQIDVVTFARLVAAGSIEALEQAAALYQGDFLAGFYVPDSEAFELWATIQREHFRRQALEVLDRLTEHYLKQADFPQAEITARRQLELDTLRERAWRQLMAVLAGSGDRSAALRQYQRCVRLLNDELGVPPAEETVALYERLRSETRRRGKMIAGTFAIVDGDTPEGMEKNLLGQGGMGHVYRGLDLQNDEPVAIKVLKQEVVAHKPEMVERFVREGEALRQLNHPNIVKMLAASEQDGRHFLVMEYVSGGSLQELIAADGPLPINRVLEISLDVADALTRAHRLNIIHRDLKPPNVLLAEDGTPRLTDFGIARMVDSTQITESGLMVGTLNYLSPEGCDGQALDERTDIWAFGVILFEMLTGDRPFSGDTMPTILAAIVSRPTPDLNQYRADIPPALLDLIGRMLAKDPEQRVSSVRLVGAELEAILAERPLTPTTPSPIPTGPPPACPYRGLFAFHEEDADFFFGREAFTQQLVAAVRERGLVAVVGSSGSGKSSVVFAGLIAQLLGGPPNPPTPFPTREGGDSPPLAGEGLGEGSPWLITTFRPGSDPFQALAAGLLPLLEPDLSQTDQLVEARKLAERLSTGDLPLADVIDRILQRHNHESGAMPALPQSGLRPDSTATRFMLVSDQFEELYTLCPEPETRYSFLDMLLELIGRQQDRPQPSFTFVFTLRADFLEQALAYRPFADALQGTDLKLGPMTRDELGRAIENPAEKQGVLFETGLVERILDDVGQEPGNLPLLEFALTALWDQQQGRTLSHTGYEAIARVEGALTRYADEVYAGLSPAEQETARRVFIQTVRPGQGTEDTRRLARRAELGEADWNLARRLADARLVVTGRDVAGNESVEVVHEALIRSWGQLRHWMQADRTFRAWQERLRAALRQWEATGQDPGALLRGVPLAEAENWLAERETDLSQVEREFIQAGSDFRRQRQAAEQAQQERERTLERSALRRLRVIVAVLVAASIAGIVLTIIIFNQSQINRQTAEQAQAASTTAMAAEATAVAERAEAERQANIAFARQLAIRVEDELDSDNFDTALLLAIEAGRTAETIESWRALRQAVTHPRPLQMTLTGHTAGLTEFNGAVWSPDGSRILTASWDGTARVWDAKTGEELLILSGHTDVLLGGARWNSDGSRILTASDDRTARVWDANTGEELLTLSGHEDLVNRAGWSPDENRILTAGDDGTARIWDAETGRELLTLSGHTNFIQSARWNADGSRIITNSADRTARVWEAATGEELLVLAGHDDGVIEARWSPDESRILTASVDGVVKLREAESGEEMLTFTAHTSFLWTAIWNADGSRIMTTSDDRTAKVWDAETGQNLLTLTGPELVKQAAWNKAESLILTASEDNTARLWDAKTGQELARFGHSGWVQSASWSPDESLILTASDDHTARVWAWDASTQEPNPELPVMVGSQIDYYQAGWNRNETLILTASADPRGYARIWDAATGKALLTLTGHTKEVFWAVWNKAESRILTASADGTARVWDAETGSELLALSGHTGEVNWAAWNANERRILTNSDDGTTRVWNAQTGEVLLTLSGHTSEAGAGWNADESRILTASLDGTAQVWDAQTGEQFIILSGHTDEVHQATWNADGSLILTRSKDGTARVWDAHTGEMILTLNHPNLVSQARWSQDEKRILTADFDGTVHVWDAGTGEELLTLTGHEDSVVQALWNGDESQLVTGSWDGTLRLWNAETGTERVIINPRVGYNHAVWNQDGSRILVTGSGGRVEQYFTQLEDLIAVSCERLTRNLTPAEWQQFMGDQPYRATCPDLPVSEE